MQVLILRAASNALQLRVTLVSCIETRTSLQPSIGGRVEATGLCRICGRIAPFGVDGDITPLCPLIWNEPRLRAAIFNRRTHREAAGCRVCRVRASLCIRSNIGSSIRCTGAVRCQRTDLYTLLYTLNPAYISEGFYDTGTHRIAHPHASNQPGRR